MSRKYILSGPCAMCPFRRDVGAYLSPARAMEISHALVCLGDAFDCHETIDYSDEETGPQTTDRSAHCGGAAIMLKRMEIPNQMMQVMERLNAFDPGSLKDDRRVVLTDEEFISHHAEGRLVTRERGRQFCKTPKLHFGESEGER